MTEIRSFRRKGNIFGLDVSGHTGYAEHGADIVCSAISTLVQTLETGLTEIIRIEGVKSSIDEDRGSLSLFWHGSEDSRVRTLVDTVIEVLKSVEKSYPSYVKFMEVEVDENDQSSTVRS